MVRAIFLWISLVSSVAACSQPSPAPSSSAPIPSRLTSELWTQVEVSTSPAQVENGTFLTLKVKLPESVAAEGRRLRAHYREKNLELYSSESQPGVWLLPIAINYDHLAGADAVQVEVEGDSHFPPKKAEFKVIYGKYKKEQLKVASKYTAKPDPELEARIAREQKMTAAVYAAPTSEKKWKGNFKLPIQSEFTSFFGTQRMFNGKRQSVHQGLDLRAKVGTPVHAAADGVVVLAEDLFFSGNTVLVDHGMGVLTQYFHFSQLAVKAGQVVHAGDLLGKSGATGRVSGPHLHWGVMMQGLKINPLQLTQRMPE